jgi:hypothetical protein
LALGEKIAEEKGKLTGMSVKSIGPEGVTIEANFVGESQGFGRFPSGRGMATATILQGPKTSRSTGQGVFVTKDGESIPSHMSAIGKGVGDRRKSVCIITFRTLSQKYAWMNEDLFLADMSFSSDLSEYSSTLYEWK